MGAAPLDPKAVAASGAAAHAGRTKAAARFPCTTCPSTSRGALAAAAERPSSQNQTRDELAEVLHEAGFRQHKVQDEPGTSCYELSVGERRFVHEHSLADEDLYRRAVGREPTPWWQPSSPCVSGQEQLMDRIGKWLGSTAYR